MIYALPSMRKNREIKGEEITVKEEEIYPRLEQMQGQLFFINLALATIAVGIGGLDKGALPALQKIS